MRELHYFELECVQGGSGPSGPGNAPSSPPSCPIPSEMSNDDINTSANVIQTIVEIIGLIWLISQA